MLGRRQEIARLQSDFYRYIYHKILNWILVCLLIIFILIGIITYLVLFKQAPNYYGNTTEGRILPMSPARIG